MIGSHYDLGGRWQSFLSAPIPITMKPLTPTTLDQPPESNSFRPVRPPSRRKKMRIILLVIIFIALIMVGYRILFSNSKYLNKNGMLEYRTNMYESNMKGIHVEEIERHDTYSVIQLTPDIPQVPPSLVMSTNIYSLAKLGQIRGFKYGAILRPNEEYHIYFGGRVYFGFSNEKSPDIKKITNGKFLTENIEFVDLSEINFPPPWNAGMYSY